MNNQICLIGRLVSDPKIKETENDRKVCNITLAVQRSFKNEDGIYKTDFISVTLWAGIVEQVCKYCHKGDLVCVRGRLQTRTYEDKNKEYKRIIEVISDKVSCVQSKAKEEE